MAGILIFSKRVGGEVNTFVAYFESSVTGLDRGAPVRFRGVPIGFVHDIKAVTHSIDDDIRIPVYINLVRGSVETEDPSQAESMSLDEVIEYLIVEKGLRASLALDSLITGKLYVAMDYLPDAPDNRRGRDELHEIPTVASELSQFLKKLEGLEIDELVKMAHKMMESIEALVSSPEVAKSIENVNAVLVDVRAAVRKIDEQIEPISLSAQDTLAEYRGLAQNVDAKALTLKLEAALDQARSALATFEGALDPESELRYQASTALTELSGAARSLRVLADYLERHPEALLRGKQ